MGSAAVDLCNSRVLEVNTGDVAVCLSCLKEEPSKQMVALTTRSLFILVMAAWFLSFLGFFSPISEIELFVGTRKYDMTDAEEDEDEAGTLHFLIR